MTVPSDRKEAEWAEETRYESACPCGWPNTDCAEGHQYVSYCDRLLAAVDAEVPDALAGTEASS